MHPTKIEYLTHCWNFLEGCNGIGCAVRKECWARAMGKRQKNRCFDCYVFRPHIHPERRDEPLHRKKHARIGVSFMGDFFDSGMKREWQEEAFTVMEKARQHVFFILTKQPQNIPFRYLPENVWLGVTINRKGDVWRIDELLHHQAKVHAISFEPYYENLSFVELDHIEWIVIGAQTRPDFQPKSQWVKSLMDRADQNGTAIFLKDNLKEWRWYKCRNYPLNYKEHRVEQTP